MANHTEIQKHYDLFGPLHQLRLEDVHGGFPDYTCAYYNGDYGKTLVQAQQDKHHWVFEGLGLGQDLTGKRILDIGCGWGPMLNAVRKRGGEGIGLTLAASQVKYCAERGLDVRLQDYKSLAPGELGRFDGVVSLGAFEHFCSIEEMLAGKQEKIYHDFFDICADRLPPGGGLFLQTMTWGKQVPDYRKLSLDAPPDSMEAILARMEYFFPGSWLPNGLDQLRDCASRRFDFVKHSNGRLDYLQTCKEWEASTKNLWKPHILPRALMCMIPIAYGLVTSRAARIQWDSIVRKSDNNRCFEKEIMSHERIFFRKKATH